MKSFTLIETIVVILIFTLLMGAVSASVVLLYRTYGYTWEQSIAIDEARRGIETMVKEIREARSGEDGSYPIEYAGDKEFIFYSDIDGDGKTERVRYFLGKISSETQSQKCVTFTAGGSCSVNFSNFITGTLKSAQVKVSVEGDLGASNEYVEIFADGIKFGNLCQTGCTDCAGTWQGTATFDVFSQAEDNNITFLADATSRVDSNCSWEEPNHKMKANFEFSFSQEVQGTEFKKGVIEPTGIPVTYPLDQEKVSVITSYVRNIPPIFEYFDQNGNKIEDYPARLKDTKVMKVYLVVNVDPNRPPQDFELKSSVQLRNLK
jgi:type II secretory pathway pseudopilin PulG